MPGGLPPLLPSGASAPSPGAWVPPPAPQWPWRTDVVPGTAARAGKAEQGVAAWFFQNNGEGLSLGTRRLVGVGRREGGTALPNWAATHLLSCE